MEVGQEVSEVEVADLVFKDQTERILNNTYRFLSFRPRSEKEIGDHLKTKFIFKEKLAQAEKEQIETSIKAAITKLKESGQIDDDAFAEWWIEQRKSFKGLSNRVISAELLKKGIKKEKITEELKESSTAKNEDAIIQKLAGKKALKLKNLPERQLREKLYQFLGRKGFEFEAVKRVVDTMTKNR